VEAFGNFKHQQMNNFGMMGINDGGDLRLKLYNKRIEEEMNLEVEKVKPLGEQKEKKNVRKVLKVEDII